MRITNIDYIVMVFIVVAMSQGCKDENASSGNHVNNKNIYDANGIQKKVTSLGITLEDVYFVREYDYIDGNNNNKKKKLGGTLRFKGLVVGRSSDFEKQIGDNSGAYLIVPQGTGSLGPSIELTHETQRGFSGDGLETDVVVPEKCVVYKVGRKGHVELLETFTPYKVLSMANQERQKREGRKGDKDI